MKVMITQSNYIPWKGFFDSIAAVDCYVVFDEMQYTKRDWRNRNKIKTDQGLKWMTVPVEVKGKFYQKINETKLANQDWQKSHLGQLKHHYKNSKCFNEIFPWIEELFLNCHYNTISEVNLYFIQAICRFLNIETKILYSKDFKLVENKTQRLVDICCALQATSYHTGSAAKNYMEEDLFKKKNISVNYWDYSGYKEYQQLFSPFEHGVTIFDLLLNEGSNSPNFLKHL